MNSTHTVTPIETAVAPLRIDACERAERYARKLAGSIATKLAAANHDLRIAAPYPNSRLPRLQFAVLYADYRLIQSLTTWRKSGIGMHEPCYADMNPEAVEAFVREARFNAAAQYDLFITKLNKKIGPTTSARLEGNHVWSHSFLHVETPTGPQCWKTQMIINISKLGKVFNQYPTRKVKGAN